VYRRRVIEPRRGRHSDGAALTCFNNAGLEPARSPFKITE
jgi:hypothetical protein